MSDVAQRELLKYDGGGLSQLIRDGLITRAEVLTATIQRVEALDGTINAVIDRAWDRFDELAAPHQTSRSSEFPRASKTSSTCKACVGVKVRSCG